MNQQNEVVKTAEEIQKEMCYLPDGRFKGTSSIVPAMEKYAAQFTASQKKEEVSGDAEVEAERLYPTVKGKIQNHAHKVYRDKFKQGVKWQSTRPVLVDWMSEDEIKQLNPYTENYDLEAGQFHSFNEGAEKVQDQLKKRLNCVSPVEFAKDVVKFILTYSEPVCNDRIVMGDGEFYWESDKDGECPLEQDEILQIYLTSNPNQHGR